ncbi:MAG: DUF692 domain-containing protein [Gammaproteobacteria bacterium]|nr:DUF692 domain-containing protein [Gammaproteobacteria bacterium]
MNNTGSRLPYIGFGLRLRREYIPAIVAEQPPVDWFEIISESYLGDNQEALRQLEPIRARYPIVMHGISLAVGSPWPLDFDYLKRLKALIDTIDPVWVSDHLCWSGADDVQGRMLPLPYSADTLDHVVPRIREIQDFLGRQILLENVPMGRCSPTPEIAEADFISEVAERSDSLILLDVANLHTTAMDQALSPEDYLEQLPIDRIQQIHLAGAVVLCDSLERAEQDDSDPLWELYSGLLMRLGPVSTMIERMDSIPPLSGMVAELEKARCAANTLLLR